jgi:hypothetical protein
MAAGIISGSKPLQTHLANVSPLQAELKDDSYIPVKTKFP